MIYIYYSAPYDLPDSFVSPEYFSAVRKDADCRKIFENTAANRIKLSDKDVIEAGDDTSGNSHYNLMIRLSEKLLSDSVLILPDITALSSDYTEADCLFQRFTDRRISLEFQNAPWLNTEHMKLLLKQNPYEARRMISSILQSTFDWKCHEHISELPGPEITQASNSVKKNSI